MIMAGDENIIEKDSKKTKGICSKLWQWFGNRKNYIKGATYDLNRKPVNMIHFKEFRQNVSPDCKACLLAPTEFWNRLSGYWFHFHTLLIIRPASGTENIDQGRIYPGHPFTCRGLPFPVANNPDAMRTQGEKGIYLVEYLSHPERPGDQVFLEQTFKDIQRFVECFFIRHQLRNFLAAVKTIYIYTKAFNIILLLSLLLNYILSYFDISSFWRLLFHSFSLILIFLGIIKTIRFCERLSDAAQIHPRLRYTQENIVYRYYYDKRINQYLFPEDDAIIREIENIPDNLHKAIIPYIMFLSITAVFLTGLIKGAAAQYGNEFYLLGQKMEAVLGKMDDLWALLLSGLVFFVIIIIIIAVILLGIGVNTSPRAPGGGHGQKNGRRCCQ